MNSARAKRVLLVLAATAGIAVSLAGIVTIAAQGGGGDPTGTGLVGDLAEHVLGLGGHGGRGNCRLLGTATNAVANTLGISVAELQSELQAGRDVRDVAKSHGINEADLSAALIRTASDEADRAVAGGRITRPRADDSIQRLKDNMNFVLNFTLVAGQDLPCAGGRFGGFGGRAPSPTVAPPSASPGH